jgi:LL-diaminopimelate aminotransferase
MEFANAEAVSQWLITEKHISTVPWDDAGANLRFSVTFIAKDPAEEQRVTKEIAARLQDVTFIF